MLYDRLKKIGDSDIQIIKNGGLDVLPDAAFDIKKLNPNSLSFDVKINDVRDLDYHRMNGLTRIK